MNTQLLHALPGILAVILSGLFFCLSYRQIRAEKRRWALLFLGAGGLILRLFVLFDGFLHTWDERYHALVSKNMMHDPLLPALYRTPVLPYDFREWSSNHIWLAKPPVPLWALALSQKLWGVNEIALRLPSLVLSLASIVLVFRLAQLLGLKDKMAWFAAFLFAIHGMQIELGAGRLSSDHVEVAFNFFVALSVFFALKDGQQPRGFVWTLACGLATGTAILCKYLPGMLGVAIWMVVMFAETTGNSRQKILKFAALLLSSALLPFCWFIYIYRHFPNEAMATFHSFISPMDNVVEGHTGESWYYLDKIRIIFGEFIYAPMLWLLYQTFRTKDRNLLVLLAWIWIPILIFSASETKRQTYLMLAAPAFFILTAAFLEYALAHFSAVKNRLSRPWALVFALALCSFIALPVRYSLERIKPLSAAYIRPQWVLDLQNIDAKMANCVLFNYQRPIEAMYYTQAVAAYPFVPSQAMVDSLTRVGFSIAINRARDMPALEREIPGVFYVELAE